MCRKQQELQSIWTANWLSGFFFLFSRCRIFVNRSLHLEKIKFYGFDMDYTLAGIVLQFALKKKKKKKKQRNKERDEEESISEVD